jgi:hypothetical protein
MQKAGYIKTSGSLIAFCEPHLQDSNGHAKGKRFVKNWIPRGTAL